MINNITLNKICSGCGACVSICPTKALSLLQDDDGFYKPKIDEKSCINCGKCLKICPCNNFQSQNTKTPKCIAFNGTDEVQRKSATAGGFQVIAEHFIKEGGKVVGAAWTPDLQVKHIIVDNLEDLTKLYKSKYLQSYMGDIYSQIKKELDKGTLILFSGVGCQVAGLYASLNKKYENLYSIDLLCHYTPSAKVFKKYIDSKYGEGELKSFDFRAESPNGNSDTYYLKTVDKNGNIRYDLHANALYCVAYHKGLLKSSQCNNCQFSHLPRYGDITLGDFHRLHLDDNRFKNLQQEGLLINNKKGEYLAQIIKNRAPIFVEKNITNLADRNALNLKQPRKGSLQKPRIYHLLNKMPIEKALYQVINDKWDIGLISFFCASNYGSAMVNNALYKTLSDLGYSVLNIDAAGKVYSLNGFNKRPSLYPDCDVAQSYDEKYLNSVCEMFLLGSDQLLNLQLYHENKNFAGLRWVNNNKKKSIFGLSLGPHAEKKEQLKHTNEHDKLHYDLSKFDVIYTRGEGEADILKQYFDIDCDGTIIDPVFLLSKQYYQELSEKIPANHKKFIFAYILDMDTEKQKMIDECKKKTGFDAIIINDAESTDAIPIEKWLSYFRDAEMILTDSFHGSCFSTIFNKEFYIIGNIPRGIKRFEVIKQLGIKNRHKYNINDLRLSLESKSVIDFNAVNELIEKEKQYMLKALKNCVAPVQKNKGMTDYDIMKMDIENNLFTSVYNVDEMRNMLLYPQTKRKYRFYKLLSKITFGKTRKRYKQKCKDLKQKIKQVRSFLKGK